MKSAKDFIIDKDLTEAAWSPKFRISAPHSGTDYIVIWNPESNRGQALSTTSKFTEAVRIAKGYASGATKVLGKPVSKSDTLQVIEIGTDGRYIVVWDQKKGVLVK